MKLQRCTRCVMDNSSDETITFDNHGVCNYCTEAYERYPYTYFPNLEGTRRLEALIRRLKDENKHKEFDCIMGISGGLDSSYLAYLGAHKWGLRILAVHIDDGYDTEISKNNIEKLCKRSNLKLITIKPDTKQFNELTRAYMFAGVPNLAIPQDNVLFANIYLFMKKHKIRTFLSGGNFALENILQRGNSYNPYDKRNIFDINKRFGREKIDKLSLMSNLERDINSMILKIETSMPLDYVDYNRERALKELFDYCGFEYYGSKHLENTLTKFIQLYWFYHKFGVDKRTSHLSSMIVSAQMTRDEALIHLSEPLYEIDLMEKEIDYILSNLEITRDQFNTIMNEPGKQHQDYNTSIYNNIVKPRLKKIMKST